MLKNLSIKGRGEENKPVQETEQQTGDRETVKTVTCPIPKGVRFRDKVDPEQDPEGMDEGREEPVSWGPRDRS